VHRRSIPAQAASVERLHRLLPGPQPASFVPPTRRASRQALQPFQLIERRQRFLIIHSSSSLHRRHSFDRIARVDFNESNQSVAQESQNLFFAQGGKKKDRNAVRSGRYPLDESARATHRRTPIRVRSVGRSFVDGRRALTPKRTTKRGCERVDMWNVISLFTHTFIEKARGFFFIDRINLDR
jgi:hypothetical protein